MSSGYAFYKSLRFRFGVIFGSLFLVLLFMVALFLYLKIQKQFENAFHQNLESGAALILGKTELNPVTVPVPQSGEQFVLIYDNNHKQDTLFPTADMRSHSDFSEMSSGRSLVRTRALETGGRLIIHYSRSANELEETLTGIKSILFLYLPIAFLLSLMAGYFFSGFLLRPISRLIGQANQNALQSDIGLLPIPDVEDELHALTLALNNMLGRLQETRKQQNAFFASAAHELRTPLSIMLTGLQVSRRDITDADTVLIIDRQVSEVRRLSALVDNLLLMSGLASRAKNLPVTQLPVNLTEILLENIRHLNPKALIRKQNFKVELLPDDGNFVVSFQPGHLNILLRNLLDNALIHGSEGQPIEIKVSAEAGRPVQLIITNPTDQKTVDIRRISKEFEKGDSFREGFGLGLWIVKELAGLNHAQFLFQFQSPLFSATVDFQPIISGVAKNQMQGSD